MPLFPNSHTMLNQQEGLLQITEQDCQSPVEEREDADTFCNENGCYKDTAINKLIGGPQSQIISPGLHHQTLSGSDDLQISKKRRNNVGSSHDGDKEKNEISLTLSSLDLLKHHLIEFKGCNIDEASLRDDRTGAGKPKLSTQQIMRLAGEIIIGFDSHMLTNDDPNMHPYSSNLTGLSEDDKLDVELVQLLLTVAENVSNKQTDRACRLLSNCRKNALKIGTPVQRVVFYFAEALANKIERETGKTVSNIWEAKNPGDPTVSSKLKHYNANLAWYQKLPFSQVMLFAGVQTMLENIKTNSKVHLIDFQMRTGVPWVVMMQALAKQDGYKLKKMKLTVIETIDKEGAEAACTNLQNFAKKLKLTFSYHIILLSDMKDLRYNQFDVEEDEVIVAYASFVLRKMVARPLSLERLMDTVKRLNPSVMIMTEVEENHNSPSFVNRFIEAFFYYGAKFDCLEDCMKRDDQDRMDMESEILRHGIHNVVATEGTERVSRSVKHEVWRAFFERFGMVEAQLSESSLFQARLVLQTFTCMSSCSLENRGKGLLVGWKETPLYTLSAWSFS